MTRCIGAMVLLAITGAARAQLECAAPLHDAGKTRTGTKLVHEFAVVNSGKTPLDVAGIKTGCGCLSAVMAKTRLMPGERTTLRVEAATATQAEGKNAWRATVRYQQDGEREMHATLTADLIADVTVTPATMVLYAGPRAIPFTVTERRAEPMKLLAVGCTVPHVEVKAEEPKKVGEVWQRQVFVRVLPTCPEGRTEAALQLSSAEFPDLQVPFRVEKKSADAVLASPKVLQLVRQEAMPARVVVLHGTKAVEVREIRPSHPAIKATWAKGPGDAATMRLEFDSSRVPKEGLEAEVAVEVSSPKPQVVRVFVAVAPGK